MPTLDQRRTLATSLLPPAGRLSRPAPPRPILPRPILPGPIFPGPIAFSPARPSRARPGPPEARTLPRPRRAAPQRHRGGCRRLLQGGAP
jgi:hypothetical protein